jgi:hypothetical protein
MKSGAEAKHAYQMSDPTPRLRSSSPAFAGADLIRGSARPPRGVNGVAAKRDAMSVSTGERRGCGDHAPEETVAGSLRLGG